MVCVGCGGGERSFRGLLELGAEGGGIDTIDRGNRMK